ncbi:MAG: 23S rRNA (pseudouridine(1915)-N(3))-methyltransferase RlmH [Alphaproteobacteria bacterium]|nr:23S rRNA (pseudouridine(1915)-N(3))-methyltransferase RlmH [Alphaproteobacteria bacterium]
MKTTTLAIGKLSGPEAELAAEYQKRLGKSVTVKEFAAPKSLPPAQTQQAEAQLLLKNIPPQATVILLDERGKDMTSRALAAKIAGWRNEGKDVIFLIGGADGVTDEIRARADVTLGFGRLTWPHKLVRVMLLEQLYRATQIIAGHPYHRD